MGGIDKDMIHISSIYVFMKSLLLRYSDQKYKRLIKCWKLRLVTRPPSVVFVLNPCENGHMHALVFISILTLQEATIYDYHEF